MAHVSSSLTYVLNLAKNWNSMNRRCFRGDVWESDKQILFLASFNSRCVCDWIFLILYVDIFRSLLLFVRLFLFLRLYGRKQRKQIESGIMHINAVYYEKHKFHRALYKSCSLFRIIGQPMLTYCNIFCIQAYCCSHTFDIW